MPIIRFDNEKFSVIYGTKLDKDINGIAEDTGISNLLRLDPVTLHTRRISVDLEGAQTASDKKRIHGHGMIVGKKMQLMPSLGMMTADCPGTIVIDMKNGTIGTLHLGWLHLYLHIMRKFFKTWMKAYPYDPKDMRILVGPSICGTCFKLYGLKGWLRIAMIVMSPWRKHLLKRGGAFSLDIRGILIEQLHRAGFTDDQIDMYPDCTFETETLSSHRREGAAKRTSNVILLRVK